MSQKRLIIGIPRNSTGHGAAVAEGNGGDGFQRGLGVELDVDGLGQLIAHWGVVARLGCAVGLDGDGGGGETVGGGGEGEGASFLGGPDDGHQAARPGLPGLGEERGVVGLHAVVQAHEHAVAGDGDGDLRLRAVDDLSAGVGDVDGDVGEVLAVVLDGSPVSGGHQLGRAGGGLDLAAALGDPIQGGAVFVTGHGPEGALGVGHVEGGVEGLVAARGDEGPRSGVEGAVNVSSAGGVSGGGSGADLGVVEIELDHGGVAVNHHFYLAVGVDHQIALVPGGQDVEGVGIVVPHGAVEIVAVLGDAVGVNNAEEGTLGPSGAGLTAAGVVPGRRLTDVVKARPDIFAGVVVGPDDPPPGVAGRCTPAHRIFIIRGEAVQRTRAVWVIGIFCSSPAVAGVALVGINAAGIESGSGLGGDDLPLIGAMSGFGVKGTIVVDTDDAAGRVDLIRHCRL